MPKILLTIAVPVTVSVLGAGPSAAYNYPFCRSGEGPGDCRYETLEQCQAALSGTPGFCQPNSWLPQTPQASPRGRARRS